MLKQWLTASLIVVLAVAGAFGYQYFEASSAPDEQRVRPASNVNVITPSLQIIRDGITAVGSLRAREAIELTAEVAGRITELNFVPGARVSEGQVLVQLDDRQASADLSVARARLADARRQLERSRRLISNNSISQSQVDQLQTAVDVAEAERVAARVRLDNHRIEAPFSGVVGLRETSVGAYLNIGDSIATLDAVDPVELRFSVPERFLGDLSLGQQVQGLTVAYPGDPFNGTIAELGTRINELGRTLPVKALIDNPEGRLRPGQFMSVSLTLREREAIVIPEQAVLTQGSRTYLFLAEDGLAKRTEVVLGSREPGKVEVREGVSKSDEVIITGQDRLSSGDRISVVADDDVIPENHLSARQDS